MTPADQRPENRSGHSAVYLYGSNASEGADMGTATYDVIVIGAGPAAEVHDHQQQLCSRCAGSESATGKPDPVKGTKMEMTYVGGLAGWIHKGEPSRYVGGMAGAVYQNTGRYRFAGGRVGRVNGPEPGLYVGGMAGWVSCQAAASAAPEARYALAS
jgi:hypothetical protein